MQGLDNRSVWLITAALNKNFVKELFQNPDATIKQLEQMINNNPNANQKDMIISECEPWPCI